MLQCSNALPPPLSYTEYFFASPARPVKLPEPIQSNTDSVRPETTCPWLMFGLVAACTFTLIGWRKWGDLPLTVVTVVVVLANVTTTLASVLMLHVGFHGRLIALYQGNLHRVQFLSKLLRCVGCACGGLVVIMVVVRRESVFAAAPSRAAMVWFCCGFWA